MTAQLLELPNYVDQKKCFSIHIPEMLFFNAGFLEETSVNQDSLALITWLISSRSRPDKPHKPKEKYANISTASFAHYVRRNNVRKLKRKLMRLRIIESDKIYSACKNEKKRKSFGYCLTDEAALSGVREWELGSAHSIARFVKKQEEPAKYNTSLPVHDNLYSSLEEVGIDEAAARKIIDSLKPKSHLFAHSSIDAIVHRLFRLKVDDYGRVHTNITNMKRETRQFLRFNGKPLVEVDIKCSQPTLVASMLPDSVKQTADGSAFIQSCEEGILYDELMIEVGEPDRHQFKEDHFYRYLYGPPSNKELDQVMRRRFPNVDEYVRERKTGRWYSEYKNFSTDLQKIESSIMIENVCSELFLEHPEIRMVTVHDSILAEKKYLDAIQKKIVRFSEK